MTNPFITLDLSINQGIQNIWNPILNEIIKVITLFGDGMFIVPLAAIIILFLSYQKKMKIAYLWVVALVGGVIIEYGLKYLIMRTRPFGGLIQETGYSMPSGHAIFAIVFFYLLIYTFKDKIRNPTLKTTFLVVCIALMILIPISRVYLGVHWFSDIIVGIILGALWTWASLKIVNKK
ncbi:MAG: phosphatase PAP2 family protein [archaeon]